MVSIADRLIEEEGIGSWSVLQTLSEEEGMEIWSVLQADGVKRR